MVEPLDHYSSIWDRKPILRTIYNDYYDRIVSACVDGLTVEIGGGVGNLKQRLPNVVTTDIQPASWLDCVADAQCLPFGIGAVGNIVMVDVLHHIEHPGTFFRDAARVLKPGGRIIMVEPGITWGSTLFFRLLHHEPVVMRADPLTEGAPDPNRDPYAANQAIPTLIATRDRDRFHRMFPELRLFRVDWFSFASFPLSGGFKSWSLLTVGMARRLIAAETAVEKFLGPLAAVRMMMVVEKRA